MAEPLDYLGGLLDAQLQRSKDEYAAQLRRVADAEADYREKIKDYNKSFKQRKHSRAEDEHTGNQLIIGIWVVIIALILLVNIATPH